MKAPFTKEQVANITTWQRCAFVHPFTRGSPMCEATLEATTEGLVCPVCHYTQDWVHDYIANGTEWMNGISKVDGV
jgi:hypothetical protein